MFSCDNNFFDQKSCSVSAQSAEQRWLLQPLETQERPFWIALLFTPRNKGVN